jgi:translation initiation factor IF-3
MKTGSMSSNLPKVNREISAKQVRLIDQNGQMVGVVNTHEAILMARKASLDLVEVSPTASPPVCKILDYGKFKYEEKKRAHKAKLKQKVTLIKEMRFRPNIGVGDLQTKIRNIRKFIEEGDKAKVSIMFRGREITHTEIGIALGNKIIEALADIATPEKPPKMEGQSFVIMFAAAKQE